MVELRGEWFWGTSIHIVTEDGCGLLKLVIDHTVPGNSNREDCELYDLNVHPSRHRQGYATRLMQQAIDTAKAEGCRRLYLWVERGSWQQQWYERLGFSEDEFRLPPHKSTLWMVKFLKK